MGSNGLNAAVFAGSAGSGLEARLAREELCGGGKGGAAYDTVRGSGHTRPVLTSLSFRLLCYNAGGQVFFFF